MRRLCRCLFALTILTPSLASAAWEERLDAALYQGWSEHGGLYETLSTLPPLPTRVGSLRFSTPLAHDPAAAPMLLDRLAHGQEAPEVRAALADAVVRSSAPWGDAIVAIFGAEPDVTVREVLVLAARHLPVLEARVLLVEAMTDGAPVVRAEAARVISRRLDGEDMDDLLVPALADADAAVRGAAAFSLGALGVTTAGPAIEALLADPEGSVRLAAARALRRADPLRLEAHRAVLLADPDPKVARVFLR